MHEDYSGFPLHLGILVLAMVCSPLLRYSDRRFPTLSSLNDCWLSSHVPLSEVASLDDAFPCDLRSVESKVPFGAFFLSHIKKYRIRSRLLSASLVRSSLFIRATLGHGSEI